MVECISNLIKIIEIAQQHTENEINIISFVDALSANSISGLAAIDSLISAYVQNNFLGPPLDIQIDFSSLNQIGLNKLALDGDSPFALLRTPGLLWIARRLSTHLFSESKKFKFQYAVSCMKLVYLHQHAFGETRCPTLKDEFDSLVLWTESDDFDSTFNADSFTFLQISCYLAVYYYEFTLSEKLKICTANMLGFNVELSSALGTRTQEQLTPLSQLLVKVTRLSHLSSDDAIKESALPKAIKLEDDNLLDFIKFTDGTELINTLSIPEQAYILNVGEIRRRSHPHDELINEQCLTFTTSVIRSVYNAEENAEQKSPVSWPILTEALFKRGSFERRAYARTERAINQLEELARQYCDDKPPSNDRGFSYFFWSRMPSLWEIDFANADILTKNGCVRSALDIHMRWQQWDQIIQSYTFLEQRDLAEKVIRDRIDGGYETPELYCCLGDATADSTHYVTAWELSKQKSARAMRSLGMRAFFIDKDLEKASDCMEKSLFINRFQISLWFTLGCCYMQKRDFENAERAFRFCVGFDPDNFEAWNNLASAVTFNGRRSSALALLKQATKWNFESWRIWDNILLMSLDVGAFSDSIQAYHRLIDLREKHIDAQAMGILVKAVIQNLPDDHDVGAGRHRTKLLALFGRVTATSPSDAETWRHYAVLLLNEGMPLAATTFQRAVQCLQKCYQCRLHSATIGWELVKETRSVLVGDLQNLAKVLLDELASNKSSNENILEDGDQQTSNTPTDRVSSVFLTSSLSSLKLNINSILARLKVASDKCFDVSARTELEKDIDSISKLKSQLEAA